MTITMKDLLVASAAKTTQKEATDGERGLFYHPR
jgi:hypothetical protein